MNNITQNTSFDQLKAKVLIENEVKIDNTKPVTIEGIVKLEEPVKITAKDIGVSIKGCTLLSDKEEVVNVVGNGYILNSIKIGNIKKATVFINNTGENSVKFTMEFSPDNSLFIEDSSSVVVNSKEAKIMVVSTIAFAMRLKYEAENQSTFIAYFNGQT